MPGYEGPNFTQVPNLCLDEHLPEMGHAETKVVLAVIRQTFGWQKRKDQLSISQLMKLTGLSNRAVIDGVRDAMDRGIIDREEEGHSYSYWLVVDHEDTSRGDVNKAHRGCEDTSQKAVSEVHTQKKETNQREKESTHAPEEVSGGSHPRTNDPVAIMYDTLMKAAQDELSAVKRRHAKGIQQVAKATAEEYEPETVAAALRDDLGGPNGWGPDVFLDSVLPEWVDDHRKTHTSDGRRKAETAYDPSDYNARGYKFR